MALRTAFHPLSDGLFAATKGDRTISNLLPVLGPPQMPMDFNVEDGMSHERWPVEKLFEGKNVYLENALSTMVKRTHNPFVTQFILPMKRYNDINFTWTKFHANRTLAPQTPVGAPAERVTQQRTRYRTTMNRYQLGFTVHAETLDNPEGQFSLALDIVNVGMAIGDTFEQMGLMALLQRKNYHREQMRKFHEPYGNAADVFGWEKRMWDIIRKDPSGRGFYEMIEEVKKAQREIISSDAIIPEGIKSLLAAGAGNQDYYIYGDGARGNVVLGSDNIGNSVANGLRIHTVREFSIDHDGQRVAPLKRIKTIGDHFRCEDYLANCLPSEYRSCGRIVNVFDMSQTGGVFKAVDFLEALDATERFKPDAEGGLKEWHKQLAANVGDVALRSHVTLQGNGFADMFLYKDADGGYKVTQVLGHMEEDGLKYTALKSVAETVAARISESATGVREALSNGRSLINKIFGKRLTDADFVFWDSVVKNSGFDESGMKSGNEFGAHEIPDSIDISNLGSNYLPAGYGSVAGLYTIAKAQGPIADAIGETNQQIARDFTNAVDKMFSAASPMFSEEHLAFNANNVPVHFTSAFAQGSKSANVANAKVAFAQNLIDYSKSPLYYTGGVNSGVSLTGELEGQVSDNEAEQAVIEGLRSTIDANASPSARAAFATTESIRNFRDKYETSPFAKSYALLVSRSAPDSSTRRAAGRNVSFSVFATTYLRDLLSNGADSAAIASVVNGVVDSVNTGSSVATDSIINTLNQWSSRPASARSAGNTSMASSSSVLTRLVASPSALARAKNNGIASAESYEVAALNDITQIVNLNDRRQVVNAEADSRGSISSLFAHSRAPVFTYGSGYGAKRSYSAISGASIPDAPAGFAGRSGLVGVNATTILDSRFEKASKELDPLIAVSLQLLLLAPVTRSTFVRLYENNARVPISILCERPLRRYETASVILAAGGENLGIIAWSKFDVHLGSDAMTKDFNGNASIWAAAIIKREERYFIVEDCVVTGYKGGESLKFFSESTFNPSQLDRNSASVFALAVPYGSLRGSNTVDKTHDIRGFYNPDLIDQPLTEAARGVVTDRPHHPSALYYNWVYRFNRLRTLGMDESDYFKSRGRHDNTITHQTMQWMWNPHTGEWDRKILNTDHFGINIYEGHGDLRTMGRAKHYDDAHYLENFKPID